MISRMQRKPLELLIGLACIGLVLTSPAAAGDLDEGYPAVAARHVRSIPCRETRTDLAFSPLGISFGMAGELYIVDSDNSIVFVLSDSLNSMTQYTTCPGIYEDCRFMDIDVGAAGELLVTERTSGTLLIYDRWGNFVGERTIGEGLTGLDVGVSGVIYAAMGLSGTVQIVDLGEKDEVVGCIVSDDPGAYPVDCLITKAGDLLVTDPTSGQVLVLGPLGRPKGRLRGFQFRQPFGLAACGDSLILVSDSDLGVVVVFAGDGEFRGVVGEGVLGVPTFIDCRDDGTLCVADVEGMTVEVFTLGGTVAE
jgi:hypothetical protein